MVEAFQPLDRSYMFVICRKKHFFPFSALERARTVHARDSTDPGSLVESLVGKNRCNKNCLVLKQQVFSKFFFNGCIFECTSLSHLNQHIYNNICFAGIYNIDYRTCTSFGKCEKCTCHMEVGVSGACSNVLWQCKRQRSKSC